MKLLVLAQIPPPVHGQSLMVRTLVEGLPSRGIEVYHVDLRLSRSAADIGRWRWGKVAALLDACFHAILARFAHGCDTLYYVPAPGKRGALWRDLLAMLLCRPFFPRLVLHWHAAGLGEWLRTRAFPPERWLARILQGGADLSIILSASLRDDAERLAARRVAIVPNGIPDPCPDFTPRPPRRDGPIEVLFLGLCSEEKGLFASAEGVVAANARAGGARFRLTAAGDFPDAGTAARFRELARAHPDAIRHAGFVRGAAKAALLRASDCLCLPSRYPHEAQPLVVLEALAHDLPVIATRWRGLAELLAEGRGATIAERDPASLAAAFAALAPASGRGRAYFAAHHTAERHLDTLAMAFRKLAGATGAPTP